MGMLRNGSILAAAVAGGVMATMSLLGQQPAKPTVETSPDQMSVETQTMGNPFGIASSAEWMGAYPRFMPLAGEAGARWYRLWPEWGVVQRQRGTSNWQVADGILATAKASKGKVLGIFCYLAPWASADGKGSRAFPMKDTQGWRDYVRESMTRYRGDIKHWEIWNEFNSPAFNQNGTARDYAEMTRAAFEEARKIDKDIKIGISCANFDVQFLDDVIKAGAADHFDFVAVHPYEAFGSVLYGGDTAFLGQAQTLRNMLAANKQKAEMPLWITECGHEAKVKADPKSDQEQAEAVAKLYTLATAQGFERTFWFEARGPAYGSGTDFGLVREDWSIRPSYTAYKTMTKTLGAVPTFAGWVKLGNDGYGFVFTQKGFSNVDWHTLVAWSPVGTQQELTFKTPVNITDLSGNMHANQTNFTLTQAPVFIHTPPADLLAQAKANAGKPFAFDGDYSQASAASCRLGEKSENKGLRQVWFRHDTEGRTAPATVGGESCIKAIGRDKDKHAAYFRVDPSFLPYGTNNLKVTVVARRTAADLPADVGLKFESTTRVNKYFLRYRPAEEKWTIPAEDKWHEYSWTLKDANFLGQWGWNFALVMQDGTKDFLIKEVRVEKVK